MIPTRVHQFHSRGLRGARSKSSSEVQAFDTASCYSSAVFDIACCRLEILQTISQIAPRRFDRSSRPIPKSDELNAYRCPVARVLLAHLPVRQCRPEMGHRTDLLPGIRL